MPFTMSGIKSFIKTFFIILTAIYPICVFLCLVVFNLPVRIISLCIMLFACMYFLSASGAKKSVRPIISSALLLTAGILCYITNKTFFLKMYSVTVSVFFLFFFGITLIKGPNMCFRFALLLDKTLAGSKREKSAESYCRKVTILWCIFFVINGIIALYTVISCNDKIWALYNGGISYGIMGLIFFIEYIVRKRVEKKNEQNL